MGTGTLFLPLSLLCFFLSSASSPPSPVQRGTGLSLNALSWASPAPDIVGVTAVWTTLLERCSVAAANGQHAWAASMHPMDEVIVLLGGGDACGH